MAITVRRAPTIRTGDTAMSRARAPEERLDIEWQKHAARKTRRKLVRLAGLGVFDTENSEEYWLEFSGAVDFGVRIPRSLRLVVLEWYDMEAVERAQLVGLNRGRFRRLEVARTVRARRLTKKANRDCWAQRDREVCQ
jgi:hypothetical protein